MPIRTILAPTDFSHHAEAALKYAFGLAEAFGATVHLLHVLGEPIPLGPDPMIPPVFGADFYRESEAASIEALKRVARHDWGTPAGVETFARWGTPVDAVLEHARSHAADLIVVATHGRTGLGHVLLGSVAERIVREAPCPVLTVRDRSTD